MSSPHTIELSELKKVTLDSGQLAALRQQLRLRCKEDLWFFAYNCCGYKDIDTELHHMMCSEWAKRSMLIHTLWMIPRGHLKTSLWTVAGSLWGPGMTGMAKIR